MDLDRYVDQEDEGCSRVGGCDGSCLRGRGCSGLPDWTRERRSGRDRRMEPGARSDRSRDGAGTGATHRDRDGAESSD